MKIAKRLCYLIIPLVLITALEGHLNNIQQASHGESHNTTEAYIFLVAPVAPEPDPFFVTPEPVVVVVTTVPVEVTKDVVLNVLVLVQEQLVSRKAKV